VRNRDTNRRLLELQMKQHAQRSRAMLLPQIEVGELRAIRDEAIKRWGKRASVYVPANQPGVIHVGYFLDDDTHLPPMKRREVVVAKGRSHREIVEQLRLVEKNQ
jgi:hypothetical protein